MERQLAIKATGKQVTRAFNEGDINEAWYLEKRRIKLEDMTDKEFAEHYQDPTYDTIG